MNPEVPTKFYLKERPHDLWRRSYHLRLTPTFPMFGQTNNGARLMAYPKKTDSYHLGPFLLTQSTWEPSQPMTINVAVQPLFFHWLRSLSDDLTQLTENGSYWYDIGADIGLVTERLPTINSTNSGILSIRPPRTCLNEILLEISIKQKALELVCEMAATLSLPQHAKATAIWGLWHQKLIFQAGMYRCIIQNTLGCNYLSLPEIHASCTKVPIYQKGSNERLKIKLLEQYFVISNTMKIFVLIVCWNCVQRWYGVHILLLQMLGHLHVISMCNAVV